MHHTTDRITHDTAFVTPDVEQWLEREIVPPWRIDPKTHRTMIERSCSLNAIGDIYMTGLCVTVLDTSAISKNEQIKLTFSEI